ncbi:MAG TPA: PIN domain-containing protein [Chloroflexi bacterium]|nr:PIN domain-containing protein [Chloroflexota bacterium]
MVNYYLDTSAMLKRYVDEPGSAWLRDQISLALSLVASQLIIVEVISAFNRRIREGSLSPADYQRIRDIFFEDCRTVYQIVPVTTAVIDTACHLLESHPLRGYDAMHLATAVVVHRSLQRRGLPALIFLCADDRLNAAALAEGLMVENPNHYP